MTAIIDQLRAAALAERDLGIRAAMLELAALIEEAQRRRAVFHCVPDEAGGARELGPGERIVGGRVHYSAAWL